MRYDRSSKSDTRNEEIDQALNDEIHQIMLEVGDIATFMRREDSVAITPNDRREVTLGAGLLDFTAGAEATNAPFAGHAKFWLGLGAQTAPDALRRDGATAPLDGLSRDQRMTSLRGRIQPNGARATVLKDRNVLLVDDVMTSGATLTACAQALARVGVRRIDCLVLARVERDDPAL